MKQEVVKIIQKLEGNILGIGLSKEMVEAIEKNDSIIECNLLNSYAKEEQGKKKKLKTVKIRKLNKYFNKKSIDTIICNYEVIEKYMNTFVRNSVYINRKKLYFFGEVDKDLITRRYHRYNTAVSFNDKKDGCIAIIDNTTSKNNWLKEIGYRMIDGIANIIDFLGDLLMN